MQAAHPHRRCSVICPWLWNTVSRADRQTEYGTDYRHTTSTHHTDPYFQIHSTSLKSFDLCYFAEPCWVVLEDLMDFREGRWWLNFDSNSSDWMIDPFIVLRYVSRYHRITGWCRKRQSSRPNPCRRRQDWIWFDEDVSGFDLVASKHHPRTLAARR